MTLDEVKAHVLTIEAMKGDDEVAHGKEDELHVEFIRYVANHGPSDLAEMAREILKSHEIDFARWCA